MTAVAGHASGRAYIDQDGGIHLNGATVYDANEVDVTDELNAITGLSATEVGFIDGVTAGNAAANKAVVLGTAGALTWVDGANVAFGTSTGTKLGTAANQKLAFFNATPVVQQTTIANATNNADNLAAQVNSVIAVLKTFGLIASS